MDLLIAYLPYLTDSGAKVDIVSSHPLENHYIYELSFQLNNNSQQSKGALSFNLGNVGHFVTGSLRLTRDKCYWLFAHQTYSLPNHTDTQILALHSSESNLVLFLFPLATDEYMGTLRGSVYEHERGSILARFERNSSSSTVGQIVVAIARDINACLKMSVEHARYLLNKPSGSSLGTSALFQNKITYCTWNSLQPPTATIAASAILALKHMQSLGIQPANFLIDDAWQDAHSRRLQSFNPTPVFLGKYEDIAAVVKAAKENYGVLNIGVWHTIQGYWQGVEARKFAGQYKIIKVTKDGYPGPLEPEGFQYYIPHPDSVQSFFSDYYKTLRLAGITFTKCDNMASIDHITSAVTANFTDSGEEILGETVAIHTLRKAYTRAVRIAAYEAFGAENIIWCMGMAPGVLWGDIGLGGAQGVKRIVRNSDDYFPNEPESHRYHIFTNIINALFLNNLDIQPDLDMFQTHAYISPEGILDEAPTGLAQASFHASFRVFGTGPVTITDVPLKSNPEILWKISGSLAPASTSPSLVIQASASFTVSNGVFDPAILEHGTGKGIKVYVNSTIGVWNIRAGNGKVVEFITLTDIAQALSISPKTPLSPVILHIQSSNHSTLKNSRTTLYDTTNPLHPAAPVRIDLDPLGWATVCVATIEMGAKIACLGLVDKYLSSRGVERTELKNGGVYCVGVRCSGTLGVWIGAGVKVGGVRVSLVEENGTKHNEKDAEFEVEELAKGNRVLVEVKGKCQVVFQVEIV